MAWGKHVLLILLCLGFACARIGPPGSFLGLLTTEQPIVAASPTPTSDWELSDWSLRRGLTIAASSLTENLTNFPVLVKLDASRIDYANTSAGGDDLRFTDGSGNILSHEIELWNAAGDSFIWVRIPSLIQSTAGTSINMYYGNSAASSTSNGPSVFSPPYTAVLHLSEIGGDGSIRADSTGNATSSTVELNGGTMNASATGIVGLGDSYDGSNSYTHTDVVMDLSGGAYTQSIWVFSGYGNDASYHGLWGFQAGLMDEERTPCLYIYDGDQVHAGFGAGSGNGWYDIDTAAVITAGVWQMITVVYDSAATTTYIVYINGAEVWRTLPGTYAGRIPANTTSLWLGRVDALFTGPLDEARIANVPRSAEWIRYNYLSATDAIVSHGTREDRP